MTASHSMSALSACAFAFLVIAAILPVGEGIKCYYCNSTDSLCGSDLPSGKPTTELQKLTVDCDSDPRVNKEHFETGKEGNVYNHCRKWYQDVEGKEAIFRECGAIKDSRSCVSTAHKTIKTTSCVCYDDYCNTASSLTLSLSLLLPLVLVAMFWN